MDKEQQREMIRESRRQVFLGMALAAGLFAVIVGILLIMNQNQIIRNNPLDNMQLAQMKKQHQAQPQNQKLKNQIREFDLSLRQEYFRRTHLRQNGSYFLLGSLALMLLMLHLAERSTRSTPGKVSQENTLKRNRTIRSIASMLVAAFAVLILLLDPQPEQNRPTESSTTSIGTTAIQSNNLLGAAQPSTVATVIPADYKPTAEELIQNWPFFRGPLQNGVSPNQHSGYDTSKPAKQLWKSPIAKPGMNSPIVWGNKVFTSGASAHDAQEIYCYSTQDGKLLWTTKILPAGGDIKKRAQATGEAGFAAPTMITDGKRVCAIFATGDIACVDIDGKRLWSKNIGVPENHYGYASSLCYYNGIVYVQWDNAQDRALIALSIADGTQVWKTARDVEMSWSSPVILDAGRGAVLVTMAAPAAIAYDPQTGKELWRCNTLMGEVAPAASTNGKAYFLAMQYSDLTALKPGGTGDVTATHVLWKYPDNLPDTSSPLTTDKFVLFADSAGIIICLNATNGKMLWEQLYDAVFYPSPTLINGNVFQLDTTGKLRVFSPLPKFVLNYEFDLSEQTGGSVAVHNGHIFIRTTKNLYCLQLEKK